MNHSINCKSNAGFYLQSHPCIHAALASTDAGIKGSSSSLICHSSPSLDFRSIPSYSSLKHPKSPFRSIVNPNSKCVQHIYPWHYLPSSQPLPLSNWARRLKNALFQGFFPPGLSQSMASQLLPEVSLSQGSLWKNCQKTQFATLPVSTIISSLHSEAASTNHLAKRYVLARHLRSHITRRLSKKPSRADLFSGSTRLSPVPLLPGLSMSSGMAERASSGKTCIPAVPVLVSPVDRSAARLIPEPNRHTQAREKGGSNRRKTFRSQSVSNHPHLSFGYAATASSHQKKFQQVFG